ncbi:LuxR C-terminal-related transcriptional regulator [Kitasatospora sp. A2-31]|uniref:helix-turn-helix transcriptional regulator n=1 Tax=Kitasatospora sp. A2-31 TaxID=2916414 RepID=UPI001EE7F90F|nr:LuxR C-terminal-related transcriptional regulator [Kitasatospora sp. A2-31]MCG6492927.1 LuxR C-terminal-related transcriptional regulator [Kitasatospora sp. A2-31]
MTRAADTPTRAAGTRAAGRRDTGGRAAGSRPADGLDGDDLARRAADLVRDAVLGDLARRVVADCGADVGLVGVPEPGRRARDPEGMVLRHWAGTRADLLHDLAVPAGTGLGGRALAERAPTWVPDYRAATTISHHYDAAVTAEDLYAMLTVPLLHGGAVHGVVYASLRAVVPFGDVRIAAVTRLAAAATRALAGAAAWSGAPAGGAPAGGRSPKAEVPVPVPVPPVPPARSAALTRREHEVLRWAATGRTNPEIAAQLGLTCNTVTGYLKNAMHKLGARNRTELALLARESGLLAPGAGVS